MRNLDLRKEDGNGFNFDYFCSLLIEAHESLIREKKILQQVARTRRKIKGNKVIMEEIMEETLVGTHEDRKDHRSGKKKR
jgi:hypothetical protein